MAKVAAGNGPCALVLPRTGAFSVKPTPTGWLVAVKATAGKAKGWSTWLVAGSKVSPQNPAATPSPRGAAQPLGGGGLEHLLGDVEVRVDLLDVVVVLERVDQAHQLPRLALVVDRDGRLRQHRELGGLDREAGGLDRLAHGRERSRGRS